jgi:hypothetical protein
MKWDLLPGEVLIYEGKASHIYFAKKLIVSLALFILSILLILFKNRINAYLPLPFNIVPYLALLLFLSSLMLFGIIEFKRNREKIALTNERVLIMRRDRETNRVKIETIPLDKLIRVSVNQTFWQRVLGTGEIIFQIPGETHSFEHIRKPKEIERAVYHILNKMKETQKTQMS